MSRIQLRIVLIAIAYTIWSAIIVYVKDYTAGDQALIPMFFSLVGLLIYVGILLLVAFVKRLNKRRDVARDICWSVFWGVIIYLVVMIMMSIATS
jgi:hypothetical protein